MKWIVSALVLLVGAAWAAETKDDRLCRAIGETKNVALQPRDRVFFEDSCECVLWRETHLGCAKKNGKQLKRLQADAAAMEKDYQAAEKKKQEELAAALRRETELSQPIIDACNEYKRCIDTPGTSCGPAREKYADLCKEAPGHRFCQGLSVIGCKMPAVQ